MADNTMHPSQAPLDSHGEPPLWPCDILYLIPFTIPKCEKKQLDCKFKALLRLSLSLIDYRGSRISETCFHAHFLHFGFSAYNRHS